MQARDLIAKIRHGAPISAEQARWFGRALDTPEISDAQVGAFAMAVCLRGLGAEARVGLTEGMRDSGDVMAWDLPGPVLDKHSTGGVGDPVSLLLAPALAECGAYVPMISGRGLGHTGGTLDKLEAIPGYICEIGPARLRQVVDTVGCAIVGATGRVAPADKRLYAIRDVSGTVDSIDLITASILSKKLAAGLDGLVLDVKTGSGAFMAQRDDAQALAQSLVDVACGAGCPTTALITDMSQPLADAAGNALEIRAVMETLTGARVNKRLLEVTLALGTAVLVGAGLQPNVEAARARLREVFTSGAAAERFAQMVAALGGPLDFAESWRHVLPEAPILREVSAPRSGLVRAIDTKAVGEAVVALGAGRMRAGDRVDPAVGLSAILPIGARTDAPLAMIHSATEQAADRAAAALRAAYVIDGTSETPGKDAASVVLGTVTPASFLESVP